MIPLPPTSTLFPYTTLFRSDHICQIAGDANHIGIGSDLDGAFGKEQSPMDIETIADLQKIPLRSEEHTSELQSQSNLVCRLLLEKKNNIKNTRHHRVPSDQP